MLRKIVFPAVAATLLALLAPSEAQAWGGFHAGYTHVGPGGVYHVGGTRVYGGYGGYGGYRYGGAAHGGYRYGGAAYGGYRYGGYGGYDRYYGGYHYSPSYSIGG